MHDDKERDLEVVMEDLLGRLLGRHSRELRGTHFHAFGRRDEDGEAIEFEDTARETAEPIRLYLQDLEVLLRHLDTDRTNVVGDMLYGYPYSMSLFWLTRVAHSR